MAKKLLFIINPRSGKELIKGHLTDIVDIMVKAGYQVTVHTTQSQGDATEKAREWAKDFDRIVCSGGDGTLDEVIRGLLQSGVRIPLGYIPAGSTNDFGSSIGIDKDMLHAAKIAVSDNVFTCDLGGFDSNSFVYVAAFGMFTEVSYATPQDLKNRLGHMAYVIEGAKQLRDIPSHRMMIEHDGQVNYDDFVFGMVTNSKQVGGFKGIIPGHIDLQDGLLEVTFVKTPKNPIELNEIVGFLTGIIEDTHMVLSFQTNALKVTGAQPVAWTLDGEFGGELETVSIETLPGAIDIVIE